MFYVRNNLTVLHTLSLRGEAGSGSIGFFMDGQPKTTISFDLLEPMFNLNIGELKAAPARTFGKHVTVANTGTNSVSIKSLKFQGSPESAGCRRGGFFVEPCEGFELARGENASLRLRFKPDFASAQPTAVLMIRTSIGVFKLMIRAVIPAVVVKTQIVRSIAPASLSGDSPAARHLAWFWFISTGYGSIGAGGAHRMCAQCAVVMVLVAILIVVVELTGRSIFGKGKSASVTPLAVPARPDPEPEQALVADFAARAAAHLKRIDYRRELVAPECEGEAGEGEMQKEDLQSVDSESKVVGDSATDAAPAPPGTADGVRSEAAPTPAAAPVMSSDNSGGVQNDKGHPPSDGAATATATATEKHKVHEKAQQQLKNKQKQDTEKAQQETQEKAQQKQRVEVREAPASALAPAATPTAGKKAASREKGDFAAATASKAKEEGNDKTSANPSLPATNGHHADGSQSSRQTVTSKTSREAAGTVQTPLTGLTSAGSAGAGASARLMAATGEGLHPPPATAASAPLRGDDFDEDISPLIGGGAFALDLGDEEAHETDYPLEEEAAGVARLPLFSGLSGGVFSAPPPAGGAVTSSAGLAFGQDRPLASGGAFTGGLLSWGGDAGGPGALFSQHSMFGVQPQSLRGGRGDGDAADDASFQFDEHLWGSRFPFSDDGTADQQ